MPYSNPVDKQRWEREHRQQRNERRRTRRLGSHMAMNPNPVPKSTMPEDPKNAENAIAIGVIVFSVVLLLLALAVWNCRRRKHTPILCPTRNS
jgi:hypothetical protein